MRTIRLSPSSINCFKACKMRYYYQYVLGLHPDKDTDSQRIGTVWHACRELITFIQAMNEDNFEEWGIPCYVCGNKNSKCFVCGGEPIPQDPMEAVVNYLNRFYESKPEWLDAEPMKIERAMILHALAGYNWYYGNDIIESIGLEMKDEQILRSPNSGRGVPGVVVVSKKDALIRRDGRILVREYKTTSKDIGPDSTYWGNLRLAVQPNLYVHTTQEAQRAGELEDLGLSASDPLVNGCLYDVFHKPGISPKVITQAETADLIKTGRYCNAEFEITGNKETGEGLKINDDFAQVTQGKKAFAIRETPDMYGARLLKDITERPEFYFQRRIIDKSQLEMERFQKELYNICLSIRMMMNQGCWYCEGESCEATFKCSYIDFCYNGIQLAEADIDAGNIPAGFRVYNPDKKKEKNNE